MESVSKADAPEPKQRRHGRRGSVAKGGEIHPHMAVGAMASLGMARGVSTAQLSSLLMASPLGYFVDMTTNEDFDALVKGFTHHVAHAGQPIPPSVMYYVQSGQINVCEDDVQVCKSPGDWVINPGAVNEADLDPRNYAWFYEHTDRALELSDRVMERRPSEMASDFHAARAARLQESRGSGMSGLLGLGRRGVVGESSMAAQDRAASAYRKTVRAVREEAGDKRGSLRGIRRTSNEHTHVPSTSATAATDVASVMLLPAKHLFRFIGQSRDCFNAMTNALNLQERLLELPLLRAAKLPPRSLKWLSHICTFTAYEAGAEIYDDDTAAEELYLLVRGAVLVTPPSQHISFARHAASSDAGYDPAQQPARSKYPGDALDQQTRKAQAPVQLAVGAYFGELPIILKWRHQAGNANATTNCLVAKVAKNDLPIVLELMPELSSQIMFDTRRKSLEMFRNDRMPFFADLADDRLRQAALSSSLELDLESSSGAICTQAGESDAFYIVLGGSVNAVRFPDELQDRLPSLGDGDSFASSSTTFGSQSVSAGESRFSKRQVSYSKISIRGGASPDLNSWQLEAGQYFGEMPLLFPGERHVASLAPSF